MQPELAVDRLQLGRLDQLAMRDLHRVQRAFQLLLPERQEALQLRKFREQIVSLPDVGLQQPTMIGTPIQDVCGRQAKASNLLAEVVRHKALRNHRVPLCESDTSFQSQH